MAPTTLNRGVINLDYDTVVDVVEVDIQQQVDKAAIDSIFEPLKIYMRFGKVPWSSSRK